MTMENSRELMPYLARYAVPRTGENIIPGYYSSELDVWVIEEIEGPLPIILKGKMTETMTKTAARREEDDDGHFLLLETITKSFVSRERDDSDLEMNCLDIPLKDKDVNLKQRIENYDYFLELTTKTDAVQERDDSSDFSDDNFGYISTNDTN